jgi:hypothetical protein
LTQQIKKYSSFDKLTNVYTIITKLVKKLGKEEINTLQIKKEAVKKLITNEQRKLPQNITVMNGMIKEKR